MLSGLNNYTAVVVTDVRGHVVAAQTVVASTNYININRLAKGMYFIRFTGNNETKLLKFIKE